MNRINQTMIFKKHKGVPALKVGEVASELNLNKCKFTVLNKKVKPVMVLETKNKKFVNIVNDSSSSFEYDELDE